MERETMAVAIINTLQDWHIEDRVCAMSFDTTSTNTGKFAGACTLLEQKLERRLLSLACRHHILEVVLQKAFSLKLNVPSSGPDVQVFKRFQAKWHLID